MMDYKSTAYAVVVLKEEPVLPFGKKKSAKLAKSSL